MRKYYYRSYADRSEDLFLVADVPRTCYAFWRKRGGFWDFSSQDVFCEDDFADPVPDSYILLRGCTVD